MDDHTEPGLAWLQDSLQSVDDRTQQGQTVAALLEVVGELAFWAIQPKVGNPIFWLLSNDKDALQERLWALGSRIRSVFDATDSASVELNAIVRDARDCLHRGLRVDDWVDSGGLERLKRGEQWLLQLRQELERDAREKRGFTRWASEVLTDLPLMNPRTLNPRQVAYLRQWVGVFVQHSGRPDDDLSTAELNAVMELQRSLRPFVFRAAQAIGFHDWCRLFAADYQSRSDAWEAFAATLENPRRPAEVQTADSSSMAIAAPQDQSAAFTAADSRQVSEKYAKPIDRVPDEFCDDGRPCGPLEGNASELLRAITGRKLKPVDLLKRHQNGRLFVQRLSDRKFAVYFQTFKELHDAEKRLTQGRNSKGRKSP
jgi:hypothetical protein